MKSLTEELAHDILQSRQGPDVLLIEDDAADAELSSDELERWGCTVDHATTGFSGIQKVRDHDYDVAIIDLRLPDLCGLDVAQEIKQIKPIIVVLICTGRMIDEKIMSQAIQRGFVIFPKPIKIENLTSVRTLCAR